MPDGSKMTYFDYYKTRYNKKISDIDQPLLVKNICKFLGKHELIFHH